MAEWYAKCPNDDNEYEITFISKNRDEYKRVEKVCCDIMDEHAGIAHPKTYAQDFFEKFPDARRRESSEPKRCRNKVYSNRPSRCERISCDDCWNEVMPDA